MKNKDAQTKGREANAAEPLGKRSGIVSEEKTVATGKKERRSGGPDGPSAAEIGSTFKS